MEPYILVLLITSALCVGFSVASFLFSRSVRKIGQGYNRLADEYTDMANRYLTLRAELVELKLGPDTKVADHPIFEELERSTNED